MKALASIRDHVNSNLAGLYWEFGAIPDFRITRYMVAREYAQVTIQHLWLSLMARVCARVGHKAEVEEFVAATRDEQGRITDIDGGGVDWHCTRCGQGGRNWW